MVAGAGRHFRVDLEDWALRSEAGRGFACDLRGEAPMRGRAGSIGGWRRPFAGLAAVLFAPAAALAGAWTLPQGEGQIIESIFGWTGEGSPYGLPQVSPPNESRLEAQTYVQYGLTNDVTIFGQTALEHYALSAPTADVYNGLDYSDAGLRARLWSADPLIVSVEATAFVPGAYDPARPAQAGNTGGAAEARLLAGYNFTLWATSGLFRRRSRLSPAHRRAAGRVAWRRDARSSPVAARDADGAALQYDLVVVGQSALSRLALPYGGGQPRLRPRRSLVAAGRTLRDLRDRQHQQRARDRGCCVAEVLTAPRFRRNAARSQGALLANSSRPISMRRISLVPAPIS